MPLGPQQPMEKFSGVTPQNMGEITLKNEGYGFPWCWDVNIGSLRFPFQISQVDKDSVRRLAEEAARRWQERDDKALEQVG